MKILFDNQVFGSQKYGGISRYFVEIFEAFDKRDDIEYRLPITYSNNEYLGQEKPLLNKDLWQDALNRKGRYRRLISFVYKILYYYLNINSSKKNLKSWNFDIFHSTYYKPYFLKYIKNKKFVLTVHDMIHELYPQYFSADKGRTIKRKKILIDRADKIIAISENTKHDIMDLYSVPEDKIKVIYSASSLQPVAQKPIGVPKLPTKYILYVGSRDIYKNFIYFMKSIGSLLFEDKDLNIIVVGGYSSANRFSQDEIKLFKELEIENRIIQLSGDDKILAYLYQNAICFVFPSLYEGFGIPVLEAFACDCPAVISDTSSLPEVGGEAAIYFNPLEQASILSSVKKVIYNEDLRRNMILKGREQLKEFSWEKTAEEMISLYSNLL